MALEHAELHNVSVDPPPPPVPVLFNPSEYGIDRGASYAEMAVPGLATPILQFVRGEADALSLDLFLDGTDRRESVDARLQQLRQFVRIDPDLHAPPVCRFRWGDVDFQGVVTSLKERATLFDQEGKALRVRVSLALKAYKSVEVQLRELRRSSPDRTRVRVVREGETLDRIAHEAYGDPRLWRVVAAANGIDRPRFVTPGTALVVPSV